METPTLLAVIGIALSLLFGIWWLLTLRHKYSGQITFMREPSIALFDTIVKNLPEVQVLHKNTPVQPDLVLLSGALVNTGKVDISPEITEKPIEITLPSGFQWLEARVVSTSADLTAQVSINSEQSIVFTSGLFRMGEYIRFQVLAKVPEKHDLLTKARASLATQLEKSLRFSHRIAHTGKIDKKHVDVDRAKRALLFYIFALAVLVAIVGFALVYKIAIVGLPGLFVYNFRPDASKVIEVTVDPKADGSLELFGTKEWYGETVFNLKEFLQKASGPTRVTPKDTTFWFLLPMIMPLGMMLYLILLGYREYEKQKKLAKLLGISPGVVL